MCRWCVCTTQLMQPPTGSTESGDLQRSGQTDRQSSALPHPTGDHLRAVLYVRSSAPSHEREGTVIDALEALADADVFEAVEVNTWPEKVSLNAAGQIGREFVEAFRTFDAWAEEHDVDICPPFVVREQHSSITQERDEVLVTPTLCLSLWDDAELAGVYPCSHGDRVTSVEDLLAFLQDDVAGESADDDATEPAERPSSDDDEPRLERPPAAGGGNGRRSGDRRTNANERGYIDE